MRAQSQDLALQDRLQNKAVCSNSSKSIRNSSQTFWAQRKKLYIYYAIPLSSCFIFIALLHRLALDLFTLVFNSDEKCIFIAISQHKGIVKHTNRLLLDETNLPDVLQLLMSVRSLRQAKFELIQSHTPPKPKHTNKMQQAHAWFSAPSVSFHRPVHPMLQF